MQEEHLKKRHFFGVLTTGKKREKKGKNGEKMRKNAHAARKRRRRAKGALQRAAAARGGALVGLGVSQCRDWCVTTLNTRQKSPF